MTRGSTNSIIKQYIVQANVTAIDNFGINSRLVKLTPVGGGRMVQGLTNVSGIVMLDCEAGKSYVATCDAPTGISAPGSITVPPVTTDLTLISFALSVGRVEAVITSDSQTRKEGRTVTLTAGTVTTSAMTNADGRAYLYGAPIAFDVSLDYSDFDAFSNWVPSITPVVNSTVQLPIAISECARVEIPCSGYRTEVNGILWGDVVGAGGTVRYSSKSEGALQIIRPLIGGRLTLGTNAPWATFSALPAPIDVVLKKKYALSPAVTLTNNGYQELIIESTQWKPPFADQFGVRLFGSGGSATPSWGGGAAGGHMAYGILACESKIYDIGIGVNSTFSNLICAMKGDDANESKNDGAHGGTGGGTSYRSNSYSNFDGGDGSYGGGGGGAGEAGMVAGGDGGTYGGGGGGVLGQGGAGGGKYYSTDTGGSSVSQRSTGPNGAPGINTTGMASIEFTGTSPSSVGYETATGGGGGGGGYGSKGGDGAKTHTTSAQGAAGGGGGYGGAGGNGGSNYTAVSASAGSGGGGGYGGAGGNGGGTKNSGFGYPGNPGNGYGSGEGGSFSPSGTTTFGGGGGGGGYGTGAHRIKGCCVIYYPGNPYIYAALPMSPP